MITKFFAGLTVRLPTKGPAVKPVRVFLANIPPRKRAEVKLDLKVIEQGSPMEPEISVKFKNGTTKKFDPSQQSGKQILDELHGLSRKMQIEESING